MFDFDWRCNYTPTNLPIKALANNAVSNILSCDPQAVDEMMWAVTSPYNSVMWLGAPQDVVAWRLE